MKWLLLCALWLAAPAWANPFATAQIPDARTTHCDYEDTTTGETARVPVVVDLVRGEAANGHRVCKFDISHWLPGSVHAARMRSVITETGLVSAWYASLFDRPASATVHIVLAGTAENSTPPPPNPMPSPSIASYNTGSATGGNTVPITLTNAPPAGGVIVVAFGSAFVGGGGSGNWTVVATGGTGVTVTAKAGATVVPAGANTALFTVEYTTAPTALTVQRTISPPSEIYGHAVAINVTGQNASFLDVSSATVSTGTSTSPVATSLPDLTDATDLVIGFMNRDGGSISGAPGSGWTELVELDEDNDPSYVSVIYRTPGSTGAYDPAWTLGSSATWYAVGIAIKGTEGGGSTRGMPFGNRGTAFNGGRTFIGPLQ